MSQAASLWGVTRATVYNWMHLGTVRCFVSPRGGGEAVAPRAQALAAKVLRTRELRALHISADALERALDAGIVTPGPTSGVARFSLDDVAAIRAFEAERPADREGRVRRESGFVPKNLEALADRERAWVERGAHPAELLDEDFDGPAPPSVIPPAGIFLYEPVDSVPGAEDARYVRRSKGYDYVEGALEWFECDDRFAVLRSGERMPAAWTRSNHYFRLAKREWLAEWDRRRRRRRLP